MTDDHEDQADKSAARLGVSRSTLLYELIEQQDIVNPRPARVHLAAARRRQQGIRSVKDVERLRRILGHALGEPLDAYRPTSGRPTIEQRRRRNELRLVARSLDIAPPALSAALDWPLRAAQRLLQRPEKEVASVTDITATRKLARIEEQLEEVRRDVAEIAARLRDLFPSDAELQAQLDAFLEETLAAA